jgi:hypothetical protein
MSDAITPVNYCTHAIEDLKETTKAARARGFTVTAARLETVAYMLATAPKFLFPNCAELIDTQTSAKRTSNCYDLASFPRTATHAAFCAVS